MDVQRKNRRSYDHVAQCLFFANIFDLLGIAKAAHRYQSFARPLGVSRNHAYGFTADDTACKTAVS